MGLNYAAENRSFPNFSFDFDHTSFAYKKGFDDGADLDEDTVLEQYALLLPVFTVILIPRLQALVLLFGWGGRIRWRGWI